MLRSAGTLRNDFPEQRDRIAALIGLESEAVRLEEALTHPSFSNERRELADNQRLEFLGDAVLGFCVGELLFMREPDADEGMLTRMIPTSSVLKEMVERGGFSKLLAFTLAEGAESLAQSSGSALMSTALNEQTWEQGNPLKNLALGTLQQSATSAAIGLGVSSLHKLGAGAIGHARSALTTLRAWRASFISPATIYIGSPFNSLKAKDMPTTAGPCGYAPKSPANGPSLRPG